jgi:hypothetical protein
MQRNKNRLILNQPVFIALWVVKGLCGGAGIHSGRPGQLFFWLIHSVEAFSGPEAFVSSRALSIHEVGRDGLKSAWP